MLANFILQAIDSGMRPTVLELFNLAIEAESGEKVIEYLVQNEVDSIEELDFSKNPVWWTHTSTVMIAELIKQQENLTKLALMTEETPFFSTKKIREATEEVEDYKVQYQTTD